MSNPARDLLQRLLEHGVDVKVCDGDLLMKKNDGPMPKTLVAQVRRHKKALVALLEAAPTEESYEDRIRVRRPEVERQMISAARAFGEWCRKQRPDLHPALPNQLANTVQAALRHTGKEEDV